MTRSRAATPPHPRQFFDRRVREKLVVEWGWLSYEE
jgi:hypothetical protein